MRKRRGSIEQRSGVWWLRIRTESGRTRIHLGDEAELRSEAAARRAGDAWISRNMPELLSTGTSTPAAQYFEGWLRTRAVHLRASTRRRYQTAVRRHLVPELGSRALARIDVLAIRTALANRRAAGCARATVMGIRAVLLAILRQARVDGFDALEINSRLVRLPATVEVEHEPRHIGANELARILEASDFPHRAAYAVMGYAGLRCSECLALGWQHLDLDTAEPLLHVRQSTQRGQVYALKTRTSRASLPVLPELAATLRDYRAVWQANAHGLLFATASGRPWDADALRSRYWAPLLKRLGIAHTGLHALRHGLPRRLFAAGVSPPIVQKLMRHASLRQTEAYTHSTARDLRAAIERASAQHNTTQARPVMAQGDAQTQQKQAPQ